MAELRRRCRARGHGDRRERAVRDRRAPRARALRRLDAHADAGLRVEDFDDRGAGGPVAAADARHQLDAHPRRQRDPPDQRLETGARGARRQRRRRLRHELPASHCARKVDLVAAARPALPRSRAARRHGRATTSKSCRRRCASSRAATTASAATPSRRSAPSTQTATSSAARRSRPAASSSSSRCASAGRSPSSSTPATRSRAPTSTRRRAPASAAAGMSPLGPIRIDLALPLDDDDDDWRVHISLGPDL